jgi:hypothetical protein
MTPTQRTHAQVNHIVPPHCRCSVGIKNKIFIPLHAWKLLISSNVADSHLRLSNLLIEIKYTSGL